MAKDVIKLIPEDPAFTPAPEARDAAAAILRELYPHARRLQVLQRIDVAFIDPGQNLEGISCPFCGTPISAVNWQRFMESAARTKFANLGMISPCCAKPTSLNALVYRGTGGFARFSLEVREPGGPAMGDADLQRLSQTLGTPLRLVQARY